MILTLCSSAVSRHIDRQRSDFDQQQECKSVTASPQSKCHSQSVTLKCATSHALCLNTREHEQMKFSHPLQYQNPACHPSASLLNPGTHVRAAGPSSHTAAPWLLSPPGSLAAPCRPQAPRATATRTGTTDCRRPACQNPMQFLGNPTLGYVDIHAGYVDIHAGRLL